MKTLRISHLFLRGAFVSASLLAVLASSHSVLAVETSGYAFGLDANTFDYRPHGPKVGLTSANSSSSTANTSAHAQSWASAKLIGGVLRKSVGGTGWLDGENPLEYFVWSAFSSGTELVVFGPDGMVEFQLVVPSRTVAENDRPSTLPAPPLELGETPVQGFFSDSLGPGFFNVFFQIDVSVQQPLAAEPLDQSLFSGGASLTSDGGFSATGDFETSFDVFDGANTDPDGRISIGIPENMVSPTFEVEVGVPFDLTLALFLTMGDSTRLGVSEETVPVYAGLDTSAFGRPVGGGGSFSFELRLMVDDEMLMGEDPVFTFIEIPEPTSLSLTLLGLLGLFGVRWRRRSAV